MRPKLLIAGLFSAMAGAALAQTAGQPVQPAQAVSNVAEASAAAAAADAEPANPGEKYTVPAGTKVLLSLKSAINTKTARPGDGIYLVSTFPVVVDGHVLIPDGVYVQGVVDRVVRPGRIKGRAQIGMHFTSLIFPNGQVVPIPGVVNSLPGSAGPKVKGNEGNVQQEGQTGRDAGTVLKGAGYGVGAGAIGGLAGGNPVESMAYGGAAGAAAGALYTMFARGDDINIPSGAPIEMVLQRPMSLQAQQFAVVDDPGKNPPRMPQQYAPLPQKPPMEKPQRTCRAGDSGCN